jgi:hypothetical protein
MSDFKRDLRQYIDGLEEPVSVQETMSRGSRERRLQVPVAVMAGAAVVLLPALVLIGLQLLPNDEGEVAQTTVPTTVTTTTIIETTTTTQPSNQPGRTMWEVPDLNGLDLDEATRVAQDAGFTIEVTEMYPSRSDFGLITAQDPLAGDTVFEEGTTVVVGVRVEAPCLSYSVRPFDVGPGNTLVTVLVECAQDGTFPDVSFPMVREVAEAPTLIEATLRALLAGLTDEQRQMGFSSFFSEDTTDAVDSVVVDGTRVTVDFNEAILVGNASTSTGSLFFMTELQANLFQFAEVDSIEFRLNGSCDDFYGWLQGECEIATRDRWEQRQQEQSDISEIVTPPGGEIPAEDLVGELVTTRLVNGSQFIMLASDPDTGWTGHTEIGGWLVSEDTFILTVPTADGEDLWLVIREDTRETGEMISRVKEIFQLPWLEVFESLRGDPFLFGAQSACTINGQYDANLVAIAELVDPSTGTTNTRYAWLLDIENALLSEIPIDTVECFAETG